MTATLEDLMQKIAKGDRVAFRDLATQMGGRLFSIAYHLMNRDVAAAEDAVQDTLIKLWAHAPLWRPTGKASAYITTILHHTCMDLHRKAKPTSEVPETLADDRVQNVVDQMIANDQHRLLMQGINDLPDRQRTAVLLSYFGNESNRHIGETLNITEGAVESLLVRARRTLARDLPTELHPVFAERNSSWQN